MATVATIITFIIYLIFLLAIGFFFYKKTTNLEDYLLGGRSMGVWVTALSAQASDMSGWLLMGLPGAVFLYGLGQSWIAIGLLIGTVLNWLLVAPRLRVYTERTSSLTLSSFFENRFKDPTGLLRIISAIITLIFFTIYASSGMAGAGKLFEAMFNIPYTVAVIGGCVVIVLYTFLGGFLAVCWTDLFQGALMFFAIIIVPIFALVTHGGFNAITVAAQAKDISLSLFDSNGSIVAVIAIISTMAWGLGYFGQPHILARFMSIKDVKEMSRSTTIATIWVIISLFGAILVGLIGLTMYQEAPGGDAEKVFIYMIVDLFNPWVGGILLAAILSAIMSTIDSQLLVSSSALTEDFYQKIINHDASEKELIWIGRLCVILISIIAMVLALNPQSSILSLVSYAWGGFGAAFGPVVLMALFSKKTTWKSALSGMVVGAIVCVVWKEVGLGSLMYEIVPGFIANFIVILVMNKLSPQTDSVILEEFNSVKTSLKK
ncbi:MAG: sodium/proline symporter PutP [Sphaerochaetaceae bacterium]|nr:sodium/proline symporter PutP [Sphaerochaetaceae bacterium]